MIEQFEISFVGLLIHSSTESGLIYFFVTTFVQRLSVVISLQLDFAASAFENKCIFFSPHPPNNFGATENSHFTHGKAKVVLCANP
jgi:hypothetical protein